MSTTQASDRFTALPDDEKLAATVIALEEHGFGIEVVDDLDAAREAALALIPEGSSVMTNTSVRLQETGIADAINKGGPCESARNTMLALDFATQAQEMRRSAASPISPSAASTRSLEGALFIASASGSQLASYAWSAANVIFIVGAKKLVPTAEAARQRILEHSLKLEDARVYAAYGQNSFVGKILEIHQELPGCIHVVPSDSRSDSDAVIASEYGRLRGCLSTNLSEVVVDAASELKGRCRGELAWLAGHRSRDQLVVSAIGVLRGVHGWIRVRPVRMTLAGVHSPRECDHEHLGAAL